LGLVRKFVTLLERVRAQQPVGTLAADLTRQLEWFKLLELLRNLPSGVV